MNTHDPGWHPPHCPNPNCKYHNHIDGPWPYVKHGFFSRRIPPRRIQRFTCAHCNRSFSSQTFSTTYWLKRPDVLKALITKTNGGMANRQIARDLGVAPSTVDNQLSHLGRHCLLFHREKLRGRPPPAEIAIDGLESFELSQYHPFHFHLAIEPDTSFITHFTDSALRRKGRMTPYQKKRRDHLEALFGRPDPKAVEKDTGELLATVLHGAGKAIIRSDLHKAYPRAIRKLSCEVTHRVVSSKAPRDRNNLLWEINRSDRMLRHSQAGHVRETLAWPKRRQRAAERFATFVVWWNYMRRRWEKRGRASPGMLCGLTTHLLSVEEVLGGRIFRSRVELPARWGAYYDGLVETRALGVNRRHELKLAY